MWRYRIFKSVYCSVVLQFASKCVFPMSFSVMRNMDCMCLTRKKCKLDLPYLIAVLNPFINSVIPATTMQTLTRSLI
ncbi:Uncharacterised protein [Vibrio cholerae]|nr:Uncharacterised protein [Vibrio cholerae]CSB65680.1 Uncharacterised protein [Vibrio cholerae]